MVSSLLSFDCAGKRRSSGKPKQCFKKSRKKWCFGCNALRGGLSSQTRDKAEAESQCQTFSEAGLACS